METILSKIKEQNDKIERDINRIGILEDGEICSNIIIKLRTFVEHIAAYHYIKEKNLPEVVTQSNITSGIPFINQNKNLKFISNFHNCLQACASHYVVSEVTSPRLMQKYLPYLYKLKKWMNDTYNVDILRNLKSFSKINENNSNEFYKPIKDLLVGKIYLRNPHPIDRYYVNSCHPIFVDDDIIYEITLGIASDYASKFNRFIVFSNEEIPTNYSIRCEFIEKKITLSRYVTNIKLIQDWCISIRPCEFVNFGKLLGVDERVVSTSPEYSKFMNYLNKNNTILDLLRLNTQEYNTVKADVLSSTKEIHLFNIFDKARYYLNTYYSEVNLVKYLAYNLNNRIIKSQKSHFENNIGLYVKNGVKPFCALPFAMSLVDHNPSLIDLIEVLGKPKEEELVYRKIRIETEVNNVIYHKLDDIFDEDVEKIKASIALINSKLHWSPESKIENVGDFYYIKHVEDSTISILDTLIDLSKDGLTGYTDFVKARVAEDNINIDSEEKRKITLNLFSDTKVTCIYGPAGTGKSFLARIISNIFKDNKKVYISNTNTAVNNIYRKVGGNIEDFMTIRKYLNDTISADILFIDECSMVSNDDMLSILSKKAFKCLVLMGDIIQIESISFGNWYKIAKAFLEKKTINELEEMHRTTSDPLKLLWTKLREKENVIDEILLQYGMVKEISDESLYESNEDEILLSLNYNGIYGINNLNNIMQENNKKAYVRIWSYVYKIGDPIIFTDNNQFAPVLYNNLKGKIISFNDSLDQVIFTLSVNTILNEINLERYEDVKLLKVENGKSIISLKVDKRFDSDKDEDKSKLVPFQIAYAVSIHKSQGLEFKNVKIVVSKDIDDEITHNIFYTAVTRSSENLTIYWSKDTQRQVLQRVLQRKEMRDIGIFSSKTKHKIRNGNIII